MRPVEFYLNDQLVSTDRSSPFEWRFLVPLRAEGAERFTLRARAVDAGGNVTWSEELAVQIVPDATLTRLVRSAPAAGTLVGRISQVALFFSKPLAEATVNVEFPAHTATRVYVWTW